MIPVGAMPGDTGCLVDMEMVDIDMMIVPGGARWYKVVPGGTRWCHSQVIPGVFLFQDSIFPVQLTEVAVVTCGKTEQNYKPGPLTTFFRVSLGSWPEGKSGGGGSSAVAERRALALLLACWGALNIEDI